MIEFPYSAVLFDFGNTLADEFYFEQAPSKSKNWRESFFDLQYSEPGRSIYLEPWLLGTLHATDIAKYISARTSMDSIAALEAMKENCRNLFFYEESLRLARSLKQKTRLAIVTVNTDLFDEVIVPHYSLNDIFELVVNSSNEN
jgi:FMN phosphatase YigB (HAD superfamily)